MDPDGEIVETTWDVFNIGLGLASLAKNVREGNVGGALLDGAGVVLDGLAAATPFVPGGAGSGIRALRAGDEAVDVARSTMRRGASSAKILPSPTVENPQLQNYVNDLYKGTQNRNRVGTGTTADAVRLVAQSLLDDLRTALGSKP